MTEGKQSRPWYEQYEEIRQAVEDLKQKFAQRCEGLGTHPTAILHEVNKDVIIRSVHESNWQEGLELDYGRTRELAEAVFDTIGDVRGPHLDMEGLLEQHRRDVLALKKRGASVEEIAAHNLTRAHIAIHWIGTELLLRRNATLGVALKQILEAHPAQRDKLHDDEAFQRGSSVLATMLKSADPLGLPMSTQSANRGDLMRELLSVEFEDLLHPMRPAYIHFLHRITLMGITHHSKAGSYRKTPVHVGNPELFFPPPSLVPKLIEEFCRSFPLISPGEVKYDPILKAAEVSHRLVRIHPYADGNGRVSRLVMNLILWMQHPPVYLKADKKGRHRYAQALRRADRGNTKPLACLIGISLVEVYQKLLDSIA